MEKVYQIIYKDIAQKQIGITEVGQHEVSDMIYRLKVCGYKIVAVYDKTNNLVDKF